MVPIVKVYLEGGSIVIVDGVKDYKASPDKLVPAYKNYSLGNYDDRVSLYIAGNNQIGFIDRYPDMIRDENGDRIASGVQTMNNVREYFNSLGIAEPAAGGISQDEFDAYKAQQEQIIADIYAAIAGGGTVTKLATPVPIASNITQTAATISWDAIPNATSYDVYLGSNMVLNVTTLNYTFAGLTAGQAYSAGVVAKAGAGFISSDMGTTDFTTQDVPQPGNNILPYTLPFTLLS